AFFTPGRVPFDLLDFFEGTSAECAADHWSFHGNEPLLGSAEDHRIVTTPAVRIGVLNLFRMQQRTAGLEELNDRLVCLKNFQAVVFRQTIVNYAGRVNIASWVELVADAGGKVLSAMRDRKSVV